MKLFISLMLIISLTHTSYTGVIIGGGDESVAEDEAIENHKHSFMIKVECEQRKGIGSGNFVEINDNVNNQSYIIGITARHCVENKEKIHIEVIDNKDDYKIKKFPIEKIILYNVYDTFKQNIDNKHLKKILDNLNANTDIALLIFNQEIQETIKIDFSILRLNQHHKFSADEVYDAEFVGYGYGGKIVGNTVKPKKPNRLPLYITLSLQKKVIDSYHDWLRSHINMSLIHLDNYLSKELEVEADSLNKRLKNSSNDICDSISQDYENYFNKLSDIIKNKESKINSKIVSHYHQLTEILKFLDNNIEIKQELFSRYQFNQTCDKDKLKLTDGIVMPGDSGGIAFDKDSKVIIAMAKNVGFNMNNSIISFEVDLNNIISLFTDLSSPYIVSWINQETINYYQSKF